MSERCAKCGEAKPVAVYLQDRQGEKHPLCQDCWPDWAESDEEWGDEPEPKQYYGPFPQEISEKSLPSHALKHPDKKLKKIRVL
jgi:hypothetical protein